MTRHAWFDVSAGAAGDMLLSALLDAGAELSFVQACVDAVLPQTVRLHTEEVSRAGQRALHLQVEVLVDDHPHRRWTSIRTMIEHAELPSRVRQRALSAFGTLAAAEAEVHGGSVEDVEFHEVGAWDSIADVVGVGAALESLAVDSISAGVLAVGSGRTRIAHGEVGVPVPAVVVLTRGWRVRAGGTGELCTPTGAALINSLAATCEELPTLTVRANGSGAGSRDVPGRANVARVIIGEPESGTADESAVVLECNVDDLDPRLWPGTVESLLAAGAYDAWLTPMIMKHGRPAQILNVLCPAERSAALIELVLRHTTTFGVRRHLVDRTVLERTWVDVELDGVTVSVKIGHRHDVVVQVTPEFRSVQAAARTLGRTPREVLAAAAALAHAGGWRPGRALVM